jgi:hypothetical protein
MSIEREIHNKIGNVICHGCWDELDELLDCCVAWHTQHDVEEILLNNTDAIDISVSTEMKAYVF